MPTRVIHITTSASEELRDHLAALTGGLVWHNVEPTVVGPLSRGFREELSRRGVRWVALPLPTSVSGGIALSVLGPRRARKAISSHLSRLLISARPALLHAHGLQAARLVADARVGSLKSLPIVCSPHGLPELGSNGVLQRTLLRADFCRNLRRCAAVIAASETEAIALRRLVAAGRIHVIPYGVERRRHSSVFDAGAKRRAVGLHQDAAIVVVRAPLLEGGPVADLLHAAALVSDQLPNVEYAIIGEGPGEAALKQLAHELRLSGSAVFLGQRPDARDVMATGNVLAMVAEGALAEVQSLEALAAGLRLVVRDTPQLRELFAGVESVPLVDLADHRAFAEALLQQLEGMSVEEDEIHATTGMAWGVSEVLASQDEFDLDRPGLDPRDRSLQEADDVERLLAGHSAAHMVERVAALYAGLLAERP